MAATLRFMFTNGKTKRYQDVCDRVGAEDSGYILAVENARC